MRTKSGLCLEFTASCVAFSLFACGGAHSPTSAAPPADPPSSSSDLSTVNAGDYRTLDDALSACPANGPCTIKFPSGNWNTTYYASNRCISRSNLSLLGLTAPYLDSNTAPTRIVGGAVVQPGLAFCGASNITIQGIGFDDGPAYFAATGIATDGLQFTGKTGAPPDPLVTNIAVSHSIALGPASNAPLHGILFDHVNGVSTYDTTAVFFADCTVIRSENVEAWEVRGTGCANEGVLIQSDGYTAVSNAFLNGGSVGALISGDTERGFVVDAEGPNGISKVTLQGLSSSGVRFGFKLLNNSVVANGLTGIGMNRDGAVLQNLSVGAVSACLLSQSSSNQVAQVNVMSFTCTNNTGLPAVPLEIDNDWTGGSSISSWMALDGGNCSELGGFLSILGWSDLGTTSTVPTFCTHDASTSVTVSGYLSTRGNVPFADLYPGSVIQILP